MKRSFLGRRGHASEEMSLQITSMADIFIIILVFLLKSYSSGAMAVVPAKGLSLPNAFAQDSSVEALRVEISQTGVLVEGAPVSELSNFKFQAGETAQNGSVQSVVKALEMQRKKQLLIAQANTDVKVDSRIIVMADQRTPYSTIKAVLASAAVNGYTDFKLAVVRAE